MIPKVNLRRSLEAAIRDSAAEFADGMAACAADLTFKWTRDSLPELFYKYTLYGFLLKTESQYIVSYKIV